MSMRRLVIGLALVSLIIVFSQQADAATDRTLQVAFVVSDGFTLIDLAGPWEAFNAANATRSNKSGPPRFRDFTVSSSLTPVRAGLTDTKVTPDYRFENAPHPDIVVVGAQDWRKEIPGLSDWLRKESADQVTIMSVCIGAGQLADAGLLDGRQATTHHSFLEEFAKGYPKTTWLSGKRFVKSSDAIWTAGGLTSGIDLALHMVELRFGQQAAQAAADYMEYTSTAWRTK
jgi:transcriptional regulator GlxA family with amidase domain